MSRKGCILLAEDDENDVFLFIRAAEEAKVQQRICVASDGQQAIDYLSGAREFADRSCYPLPSLLLLDLKMPRRTGMEVLQWVRGQERFRCLPVIVFSSSAEEPDLQAAYRCGANAYVVKPASCSERAQLVTFLKTFWMEFTAIAPSVLDLQPSM
jgi:CheY-like chemotaxis protein